MLNIHSATKLSLTHSFTLHGHLLHCHPQSRCDSHRQRRHGWRTTFALAICTPKLQPQAYLLATVTTTTTTRTTLGTTVINENAHNASKVLHITPLIA